jgi:periplasmic divalent cation tolerance protein
VTSEAKLRIIFEAKISIGRLFLHTDAVVVLTTIANEEEAVKLIRELLDRRLIACGTVQAGARSLYRWEGKIADEVEAVLMLKTRSGCIEGLRRAFAELHPYKVPELLAIPVTGGLERYLGWINSETSLTIA